MNARRESKERNLTWRIQEDRNYWTHLEHFLESILYILYFILNLKNSGVQRFKRCANRSWNEEVMVVWRQPHQAVRNFATTKWAVKISQPKAHFARCFAAAKPPASTRVPLHKLELHFRSCEPNCEITSKLQIKLQIISKLWNHLQVAKSQIQLAKSKYKFEKWIIQHVNHLMKSTCAISDICNRLS